MPLIGFADYGVPKVAFSSLASSPVRLYKLNQPEIDEFTFVSELSEDDHVVFQASSRLFTSFHHDIRCRVSLLLLEPRVIQGRFYRLMPLYASRYYRIFSHYPPLVSKLSNSCLITHGGSWLNSSIDIQLSRPSLLSLIASSKRTTEGQRLRHRIASWALDKQISIQLLGRGYKPFDSRSDGFLPFCYSVVIENSRDIGYFTEKLIDCLLCGTVPIYWGDPEIWKHFDMDGFLLCSNEEEIRFAIMSVSHEDYLKRRSSVLRNAMTALKYVDHRAQISSILRALSGHHGNL